MCFECIHVKCVICFCMFLFHSQVASARLRGIERPQFIGSSIETLLFGTFFYLVTQRKNLKGIFSIVYIYIFFFWDTLYDLFFYSSIFCPRGDQGFAPTLDPIQSLGYKGLASHSVCFESCCSNTYRHGGHSGTLRGHSGTLRWHSKPLQRAKSKQQWQRPWSLLNPQGRKMRSSKGQ